MPSRVLLARAVATALAIALIPGLVNAEDRTQSDIREQFGDPDAFSIVYFDEPAADGSARTITMS